MQLYQKGMGWTPASCTAPLDADRRRPRPHLLQVHQAWPEGARGHADPGPALTASRSSSATSPRQSQERCHLVTLNLDGRAQPRPLPPGDRRAGYGGGRPGFGEGRGGFERARAARLGTPDAKKVW